METDYTAIWHKYSEQIKAEVTKKIQSLMDKYSYYTEDKMYKAIKEDLLKEEPFFSATFHKSNVDKLSAEELFEKEAMEDITNNFIIIGKEYKPQNQSDFFEYFFNEFVYHHIEKLFSHETISKEKRFEIMGKYLGRENRPYLLRCIVRNIEYWTALNGFYINYLSEAGGLSIKRYLGIEPQESRTEPIPESLGLAEGKNAKPKDMMMLLYMLSEYEVFNFVADRANTQQIVNALYGKRFFKKSRMPVNKYFSPEVLKTYLQGQKNQAGKVKLAEILRKIANRLDN